MQVPSTWSTSCLMTMCSTCWSPCTARSEPMTSWGPWREKAAQVRQLSAALINNQWQFSYQNSYCSSEPIRRPVLVNGLSSWAVTIWHFSLFYVIMNQKVFVFRLLFKQKKQTEDIILMQIFHALLTFKALSRIRWIVKIISWLSSAEK